MNLLSIDKKKYPFLTVLVLLLLSIIFLVATKKDVKNSIWSDAEGYYMYLPAFFIYDGFEKLPVKTTSQYSKYPNTEKYFTKYTYGVALLQSPFFLTAHVMAKIFSRENASGYSRIYGLSVFVAALTYCMLGLLLLMKVLKEHFSYLVIVITIIGVYAGTNLFYYTVSEPGMSHVYSFFLFCLVIYLTPRYYNNPTIRNTIYVALVLGLVFLVRYTGILLVIYFILYGVKDFESLWRRIKTLFDQKFKLAVFPLIVFTVFIPQMVYWNYLSGDFFMYSYSGEGFIYWNKPKIYKVLLDVQNGLLIYSPVVVITLIGLVITSYKKILNGIGISIIFILATYTFASWWAWWFGGAFGHRCYVEYYALLSFPLAFTVQSINQNRSILLKGLFYLLFILFIYYNVGLTSVYSSPWDGPNWNWSTYWNAVKKIF